MAGAAQVLHSREESQGPRRAASREEPGRRESRSLPSRPELELEPLGAQPPDGSCGKLWGLGLG